MTSKVCVLPVLAACLAAATATAQTTKNDKDTITVTGCLQPDTRNTLNSPMGPGYKLMDVTKTSSGEKAYVLDAPEVDLKPHVGHKVEISGVPSIKRDAMSTPETRKSEAAVAGGGTRTIDNGMPRLKVSKVTMISADCPPK